MDERVQVNDEIDMSRVLELDESFEKTGDRQGRIDARKICGKDSLQGLVDDVDWMRECDV